MATWWRGAAWPSTDTPWCGARPRLTQARATQRTVAQYCSKLTTSSRPVAGSRDQRAGWPGARSTVLRNMVGMETGAGLPGPSLSLTLPLGLQQRWSEAGSTWSGPLVALCSWL